MTATEHVSGNTKPRELRPRGGQTIRRKPAVNVTPDRTRLRTHGARISVDLNFGESDHVQQHRPGRGTNPPNTTTTNRDLQTVTRGELHTSDHVRHRLATHDSLRDPGNLEIREAGRHQLTVRAITPGCGRPGQTHTQITQIQTRPTHAVARFCGRYGSIASTPPSTGTTVPVIHEL
jgi:hypothetical protein